MATKTHHLFSCMAVEIQSRRTLIKVINPQTLQPGLIFRPVFGDYS
ncbi:hypothetical protein Spb1_11770 [Planctopirus ephydatiae]|uniref:Uncharacterized protein n=1 Tax=Planctopirus ephydatiae TaxID=2528019 RepID=A0A518GL54_9PLAN|nr:hypothetical protein Spb1_11770 [Planctopirus ephydatiae]